MMMIAVSQLLARSLAYALIAVSAGEANSILAVICEVAVFFLYKLVRKDFYHQAARMRGVLGFMASFLQRFVCKVITDFTSLMVLRNPNEMGGKFFASLSRPRPRPVAHHYYTARSLYSFTFFNLY
jgi:hypothetical protein